MDTAYEMGFRMGIMDGRIARHFIAEGKPPVVGLAVAAVTPRNEDGDCVLCGASPYCFGPDKNSLFDHGPNCWYGKLVKMYEKYQKCWTGEEWVKE